MIAASFFIIAGFIILIISADKFVEGASVIAEFAGMSPLLIGILIVGFGTSAPELVVSISAATGGNPSIAIGNAYGSNIVNIGLVLGLTSIIKPISVKSLILKKELPVLALATLISFVFIFDLRFQRYEGVILIVIFLILMIIGISEDKKKSKDSFKKEIEKDLDSKNISFIKGFIYLFGGLVFLTLSSKILVKGTLIIADKAGVSELIAGLTIVAIGTSLPELASSIAAARKGNNDIALGNIIGSNLFNTLIVTGTAFSIHPSSIIKEVLTRDFSFMMFLTLMIFILGLSPLKNGEINRFEGVILLSAYITYTLFLIHSIL